MNIFKRKNSLDDSEPETIDGERSVASVNNEVSTSKKITNIVIFALIAGVILFALGRHYAYLEANARNRRGR